ncbi:lytic transglycosylase domain-containing protein [Clostridium disporicum]|uniref:Transglycosylase n=1 Tax=Clostridium disporicum TaxID=84024 RepID=A0A174I0B9_9CLOT|nr:lytic transglycosylase domain-containing protein [Clostridium disporicum]CUO80702.1 transglycosylase [Clostridium disporicum]
MSNNIQGLSDIYSILQLYGINSSSSTNSLSSTSLTNSTSKSSLNDLSSLSSLGSVLGTSSNSSSSSSAFNIMLTSLLSAISEKNKYAKTEAEKVSLEGILSTYNSSVLSSGSTSINNYITADVSNLTVDERIENAVELYSNQHGVDSNLVKAIIKVESNFDPNVVSSAGAKGLMQLMPENCKALGVEDPFNIEQNIEGGVKHIKEYIDRYDGDIEMALMAYNGGPTRMMNRGVTSIDDIYKMPKETQNYVPKVMSYYRGFTNGN